MTICSLLLLAWLDEMLRNFLWVPLTSYAKQLDLQSDFLGLLFAVNVGARFVPNFVVTQLGVSTEMLMMSCVLVGYLLSFFRPDAHWALVSLAFGAGVGFVRPCITLRTQILCEGDLELLAFETKRCGAARTFADVCSYIIPAAIYDIMGWNGVTFLGATLAATYLVAAWPLYRRLSPSHTNQSVVVTELDRGESTYQLNQATLHWIDWVIAAAFVGTELQWNLLNTAVPAALVHRYAFRSSLVGLVVGFGCFVTFGYLLLLPRLPSILHQQRPLNLIMSYHGMGFAWIIMLVALEFELPCFFFISGSYLFLVMANSSQIIMLECLSSVCNVNISSKILGISEMGGCAFGMAGSYAGVALLSAGLQTPFGVCSIFSTISAISLALCLGQRRTEVIQTHPTVDNVVCPVHCRDSLQGLEGIIWRADSFITPEIDFRQRVGSNSVLEPEIEITTFNDPCLSESFPARIEYLHRTEHTARSLSSAEKSNLLK